MVILDFLDFHTSKILHSFEELEKLLRDLQDYNFSIKDRYVHGTGGLFDPDYRRDDNTKAEASTLLMSLHFPEIAPNKFSDHEQDYLFEDRSRSEIISDFLDQELFTKHSALLKSYKICFINSTTRLRHAISTHFAWQQVRLPDGTIALGRPVSRDIMEEIDPWNKQIAFKNLPNEQKFSESDIQADKSFGAFILQFMQCVMTQDRLSTELWKAYKIKLLTDDPTMGPDYGSARFIRTRQRLVNDINQRLYQIWEALDASRLLVSTQEEPKELLTPSQIMEFFTERKKLNGFVFDYVQDKRQRYEVLHYHFWPLSDFSLTPRELLPDEPHSHL